MELKNVEIIKIGELKTFPNSDFTCVEWVVKTKEEYPQTIQLQSNKDKADNVIKYNKVGDVVNVSINLRGREWINKEGETKYFNTIEAWKVFKAEDAVKEAAKVIDNILEPIGKDEDNDLPF